MEYKELKEIIAKKKEEQKKLFDDYRNMCDKFYKDRDNLEKEIENLFIAYLIKPDTNVVGRCFKMSNNAYIKILDTNYETPYNNSLNGVPFKVLCINEDKLNGDGILTNLRYDVGYRQLLFNEDEITREEFNEAFDRVMNGMKKS